MVRRKLACMEGPAGEARVLSWKLLISVTAGAGAIQTSLMVFSPYGDLLYLFLVAPIICVTCLVALLIAGIRKRQNQFLSLLATLLAVLALTGAFHLNSEALRASLRWLLWSHRLKTEVLAQPAPAKAELRHMEWDGNGFAGMDTTIYLVFDPTDSLSAAAKSHSPGRFRGIPCEVSRVRRLERGWYSVQFYTDQVWANCGEFGSHE